jgi:predicted Rossmann fold nucleotide-binding protein DprA/Smf involved in DNA uptake
MTDPVMRALAYLSRVVEPPCPQLAALVAQVGPAEAADRVKRCAIDEQLLYLTEECHEIDSAARELTVLEQLGGRLVTAAAPNGHCWPLAIADLRQQCQLHSDTASAVLRSRDLPGNRRRLPSPARAR